MHQHASAPAPAAPAHGPSVYPSEPAGSARPSRSVPLPAAVRDSGAKRAEWDDLEEPDRALLTETTLARWVGDLASDDYTLAEVVHRERRRLANIKSFRQGAELTDTEWKLWRYLGRHEGKVVTKLEIARHLWQTPDRPIRPWMLRRDPETHNASPVVAHLQNLISDIRAKLEIDPLRPQHLATVRGVGYVWYDAPPAVDDGVDYGDRSLRYSRLREQVTGLVYGPALGPGETEGDADEYLEGEVISASSGEAVAYDTINEQYRPSVRTGPEYERIEERRAARRQEPPAKDRRGVPFPPADAEGEGRP